MTLINDVKKTLRDSGVEMDADDITALLRHQPRYRGRVHRTQVAHALQALSASEPDVIRTRTGLYQHVPINRSPLPVPAQHPHPHPAAAPVPPALKIIECPLAPRHWSPPRRPGSWPRQRTCAPASRPLSLDLSPIGDYLTGLAELWLRRHARLAFANGLVAAAAEATRVQYSGQDLIIIGNHDLTAEAAETGRRLHRPVRVWHLTNTAGHSAHLPAGVTEMFELPLQDLLDRCQATAIESPHDNEPVTQPSRNAAPVEEPAAFASPTSDNTVHARRVDRVDVLWRLDDTQYRRPIDGITGRGNAHSLKRQALHVGETYANRWWHVVNDDSRDQIASRDGQRPLIPGRLYPDLLNFAEHHGMQIHGSHMIKDYLRQGFWRAIEEQHTPRRGNPAA